MIRHPAPPGPRQRDTGVEAVRQTGDKGLAKTSSYADVGARYAQALFDLAEQDDAVAVVEADLKGLQTLSAQSGDFSRLLNSPAFGHADKAKGVLAVAKAAGVHPLTQKFLGLLGANARVGALSAVTAAFAKLAAARRGTVAAEVVTATPLTESQAQGVAAALRQALGRDPEITTRVDPSILGGLRVKVGSRLFDASLRTRLDQMKFALKRA